MPVAPQTPLSARSAFLATSTVIVAAAAWFAYLAVFQVDDAFIVYRFAENLAGGDGFVFNPGQRVEGVTCFSWTVLLAVVASTGASLPSLAPLLTAVAGLLILYRLPRIVAQTAGRKSLHAVDLIAPLLLAAHPAFAYWAVGALETVPYTLLLLLSYGCTLREGQSSARTAAVLAGLAAVTRPEGVVLGAAIGLGYALRAGAARDVLRRLIAWHTVVAAFLVPLFVFRRLYFGEWLPNTYYAKTGADFSGTIELGWSYTQRFLASLLPLQGDAWWLGGLLMLALLAYGLSRPALRGAALACVALVALVVYEGGDWMHLHRFYVPLLPFIALLAVAAGKTLVRRAPAAAAITLVFVAGFVSAGIEARNGPTGLSVNAEGYRHAHLAVAEYLKSRAQPGDSVALMDIGMIGYYSDMNIIDISGLTEPEIAHAPGGFLAKQFPPEWLLVQRPRFVVLVPTFPIDTRIALHAGFRQRYEGVFRRDHQFNRTPPGGYFLTVFEENR